MDTTGEIYSENQTQWHFKDCIYDFQGPSKYIKLHSYKQAHQHKYGLIMHIMQFNHK